MRLLSPPPTQSPTVTKSLGITNIWSKWLYDLWEWTRPKWDDLRFPAANLAPGSASSPGWNNTYGLYVFDSASTEYLWAVAQLPHAWLEGSDLEAHVHWAKTTSAAGNVYWQLEYRWWNIGEVLDGSWTTLSSTTPIVSDGDTALQQALTAFATITPPDGTQVSDSLVMRLSRVGGDAGDTYGADAYLIEFDIHYLVDSLGSRLEYEK